MQSTKEIIQRVVPALRPIEDPTDVHVWIGLFQRDEKGELRELDYRGYFRQQHDGGDYFIFQMPAYPQFVRVHALGLVDQQFGTNMRPWFIILDTALPGGLLLNSTNAPTGDKIQYPAKGISRVSQQA